MAKEHVAEVVADEVSHLFKQAGELKQGFKGNSIIGRDK